jgi:hypothetical protein
LREKSAEPSHVEHAEPVTKKAALTKKEALVAFLRERFPSRPPLSVDEMMRDAKNENRSIGKFSKRTFEAAIKSAYPKP